MDTIRIFVGTDRFQRDHGAEDVLEHSIRKFVTKPFSITWMRAGDPGWEVSEDGAGNTWRVGKAVDQGWSDHPGSWATPFSCFRLAIPELCGFEGRAIYLDADMLVLSDISELWRMAPTRGRAMRCINLYRTDVSVIDCSWFGVQSFWPRIAVMKAGHARLGDYLRSLNGRGAIDPSLPVTWNDCDGEHYVLHPHEVNLVHYTNVRTGQPYRPYPNIQYPSNYPFCANETIGELWWAYYGEALTRKLGADQAKEKLLEATR